MDLATFRARSGNTFAATSDAVVGAALASATARVDTALASADDRVFYLTAHLLSIDPAGQMSRLESDNARTTYLEEYERLCREAAGGPWIAGMAADGTWLP